MSEPVPTVLAGKRTELESGGAGIDYVLQPLDPPPPDANNE
jgi:hypothetical protein